MSSPLMLVSACDWMLALNPADRMFEDGFGVRNDTSELVRVTPLGGRGGVQVLPQYWPETLKWITLPPPSRRPAGGS